MGASGPQPSGLPTLAPEANKKIVKLGSAAINDRKLHLPKERVDALSKSFGNFDRVVGLGWLLGDAVLGAPLLSHKQAYDVGLKARREAGYIEKAEKKLKNDASREKSKMLGQSEYSLSAGRSRQAAAGLHGQATAGDSRRRPTSRRLVACCTAGADGLEEAGAAGSTAAEPTEDELIAGAEDAVVAAEKEVKRATTRTERAEAKLTGASDFQKYNAALHEYYRAEFLRLHDQLLLKDAELWLSPTCSGELRWSASSA